MKQVFAKYAASFLLIKLFEFASCTLLATILILAAPGTFYADVGAAEAVRGGLIFSGTFFLLTLYPVASFVVLFLTALWVSSARWIAGVSGVFILAYSAFFALSSPDPFPASFWVAWLCMGIATFLITLLVFQRKGRQPPPTSPSNPAR